jgi:hypothetical protein
LIFSSRAIASFVTNRLNLCLGVDFGRKLANMVGTSHLMGILNG